MRLLFLCLLIPLPALADPPKPAPPADLGPALTAEEFDAYSTGKTLTYSDGGALWGQEEYLPDRQVVWAFKDQPCEYGSYRGASLPDGSPMVCFTYEDHPGDVDCWQFYHGAKGLVALFVGDSASPLSEVGQTSTPMACPGPQVGA